MTVINRLIRDAKNGAKELTIRPQDINAVVDHATACMHWPEPAKWADVHQGLLKGELRMLGVPIRVLGSKPSATPAPDGVAEPARSRSRPPCTNA